MFILWFLIICVIGCLVICFTGMINDDCDSIMGGFCSFIVGVLIIIGFVHASIITYPNLMARRDNLVTLQQEYKGRMDTVYTFKTKRGLGGVVYSEEEKINQEKMLKELFEKIVNGKSEFNADLRKQQIKLTIKAFQWFGTECLMDKRILEIKPIP